ncbi:putative colanic acid biosysnthesis UDP-glucose lipid carrier transferase [Prevotella sp. ne3005]|uniref:hypothetical protein n=1 Tax=Prevotella sp. ne3005 TaxID=1761887 RepID=UPI0008AFDE0F|nr:hypothetical protein [Prevotella sp. ne3005]SEM52934.1 putative colanic acid biosysnthesis UDP-glucose lipid carrier transferase [Prevotella sp. ne3005]
MSNNNQSNRLIKWIVMLGDFMLLNALILIPARWSWQVNCWPARSLEIFVLVNNLALILAQLRFSTIIHLRLVGAGDILQRIVGLTVVQSVLAYVLLKVFDYYLPIGWIQWGIGTAFFLLLVAKRLSERWFIRLYRQAGRNTRAVTLVGSDPELVGIYRKLKYDETLGYRILGYYGEEDLTKLISEVEEAERRYNHQGSRWKEDQLVRLGSFEDFVSKIN